MPSRISITDFLFEILCVCWCVFLVWIDIVLCYRQLQSVYRVNTCKWLSHLHLLGCLILCVICFSSNNVAVGQNLVPLVNIKIAGKWVFIPLKMVLIGIDPYPCQTWWFFGQEASYPLVAAWTSPCCWNVQVSTTSHGTSNRRWGWKMTRGGQGNPPRNEGFNGNMIYELTLILTSYYIMHSQTLWSDRTITVYHPGPSMPLTRILPKWMILKHPAAHALF